jgi:glycosyltransferase involved in cell wall biosynthesis
LNILYLHQYFVARTGTAGWRSYEFSRYLVRTGHKVTVVSGFSEWSGLTLPAGQKRTVLEVDGIEVRLLGVPYSQRMSMSRRLGAFAGFMLGAGRECARVPRPDVVFATSTPLTIAVPGLWAARRQRCPFVFEVRDLWPAAPIELGVLNNPLLIALARGLERLAYRRAAHIVALSPGMKDGIVAAGVPAEKVTVIPNASDVELFRVPAAVGQAYRAELGELGRRPWLVYTGAFGRVNGVDWAVRLAESVARLAPEVAFVFYGDGSEKERTVALARDLGLLDRTVFFRDPLPRAELPRVLSAAMVLSSFAQDLPVMRTNSANKFFDAFAAGKPVVINYGGWQAEILEREGAGLALDPRDLVGSARRLVAALSDTDWLRCAGEASARLGDTEFNRGRLAEKLEEVLRRAVAKGRAGV